MNKIAIFTAAAAALISAPALAADMTAKAPLPVPLSWTGLYIGGEAGGEWMHDRWTATSLYDNGGPVPGFLALPIDASSPRSYRMSSGRVGGYLGYNWQFDPKWVVGLEADGAYANASSTRGGLPGCVTSCVAGVGSAPGVPFGGDTTSVKMGRDASARVRLGYLVTPDTLIYGTGGVALQRIQVSGQCGPAVNSLYCTSFTLGGPSAVITRTTNLVGGTIGVGMEKHISASWLIRAEYRYADFGKWNTSLAFAPPAPGIGNNTYRFSNAVDTNTATVGLAYEFGVGPIYTKH